MKKQVRRLISKMRIGPLQLYSFSQDEVAATNRDRETQTFSGKKPHKLIPPSSHGRVLMTPRIHTTGLTAVSLPFPAFGYTDNGDDR